MDDADREAEGHNPLCGDQVTVWLRMEGDVIEDVELSGRRVRHLEGVGLADDRRGQGQDAATRPSAVRAVPSAGHRQLPPEQSPETLGKLAVFSGVSEFPVRVKCASLSWHTLKAALDRPALRRPVNREQPVLRDATLNQFKESRCMPYNPALVAPMRDEMTRMGARELTTVAEVDAALGDQKGTMLVFVNSVCGCAAGNARPALRLALQHGGQAAAGRHGVRGAGPRGDAREPGSISPTISPAARRSRCCATARSCTSCTATRSRAARRRSSRPI